jgi:hypothetical protein
MTKENVSPKGTMLYRCAACERQDYVPIKSWNVCGPSWIAISQHFLEIKKRETPVSACLRKENIRERLSLMKWLSPAVIHDLIGIHR